MPLFPGPNGAPIRVGKSYGLGADSGVSAVVWMFIAGAVPIALAALVEWLR